MKKKKSKLKRIILLVVFVCVVALLAVMPYLASRNKENKNFSIISAQAETGSVTRFISGGGYLESEDKEIISLPEGVEILEFLVDNGDRVLTGDPIAKLDRVSIMSTITELQDKLDAVNNDLSGLRDIVPSGAISVSDDGAVFIGNRKLESDEYASCSKYLSLADEHREYEETLFELFLLYQDTVLKSSADGMVYGLDDGMLLKLASSGSGRIVLLGNSPSGDADLGYTNYVGVVDSVEGITLNMKMNPTPYYFDDYSSPVCDSSESALTAAGSFPVTVPVYQYAGGAWVPAASVKAGDILVFAYDASGVVWIVKIGNAGNQEPSPGPEPGEGEDPDSPGTPDKPDIPGLPDIPGWPGTGGGHGSFPNLGAFLGGFTGGRASSSAQASPAETRSVSRRDICNITPLELMHISVSIDEQDIAFITAGMHADIELDAIPGQVFSGEITRVSLTGTNAGGSSKFAVTVTIPWDEGMLPGMNGGVKIVRETVDNVLLLPVAALQSEGSRDFVYTAYDAKSSVLSGVTDVVTGASDGINVEIISGLSDGAQVFYPYYDILVLDNTAS